jgi:hypothetical protein
MPPREVGPSFSFLGHGSEYHFVDPTVLDGIGKQLIKQKETIAVAESVTSTCCNLP